MNRSEPMDCGPNVDQTPNVQRSVDMGQGLRGSGERTEPPDPRRPPGTELVSVGTLTGWPVQMVAAPGGGGTNGEVRPEARSVALASEYAQAEVRIWPEEKPGVRPRGDLRKGLFAGAGELACLIAGRPYPPRDDLDLTPIYQGHAPDEVHLVEDQAGGGARRGEDHFDVDPVTGAGERRERDIAWFGLGPRSQVGGRHDDAVAPTPALAEAWRCWPDVHVPGRARRDEGLRSLV
jgi:hypothetical protein